MEACYSFSDNAVECVVHGCDVLASLALMYVLSEHTLVQIAARDGGCGTCEGVLYFR